MESNIISLMRAYLSEGGNKAAIEQAVADCEAELRAGQTVAYRAAIPDIQIPGPGSLLRSLWVFAFAPHAASEIHRHSNSTQYTATWRGDGTLMLGPPDDVSEIALREAESDDVDASAGADGSSWVTIPAGVFHQATAGEEGWVVISFHTVPGDELQEEPLRGAAHYYSR
jgi:hypothetical protein